MYELLHIMFSLFSGATLHRIKLPLLFMYVFQSAGDNGKEGLRHSREKCVDEAM